MQEALLMCYLCNTAGPEFVLLFANLKLYNFAEFAKHKGFFTIALFLHRVLF